MAGPSTITRLSVLLFLFRQICGVVITVPEEMVPENIMTKDPNSKSGFSINQDVLNQLLTKMSSIIKRTDMHDDQVQCRECENEDDEPQDNHEEYVEENSRYHQAENSNYHQQGPKQTSRNKYSTNSPQQHVRLEEKRTEEHTPVCEYVDSGKETLSTPYPLQAPQAVYQRQDESSKPYQTAGVEYQTIPGQYPFTEFSPKLFDKFKQIKASSTNQYFIQDSSPGMQQRPEQQQSTTRPVSQSNMQAFAFSGRQQTPNVQSVQQEPGQREERTADCYQHSQHSVRTPEQSQQPPQQAPSHPSPRLQLGNVSVRRASYPLNN